MSANTSLAQDQATVLKVWAAVGGTKQVLTNGSDDVSSWKGIRVRNGRVTDIGEIMLMGKRLGLGSAESNTRLFVLGSLARIQAPTLGSHIEGDREL